ncbi:MAG: sulfide/dihydroorotate dehydrogenase-like FAD/NAD-binding protein [Deltaproteobacteria bacterium]|nr:sulfide/dihydroorotate dehydrogenase-like FAD/NAD-binding protein [Deltaproteobacteria bacterium]
MNKIVRKKQLSQVIAEIEISAPHIAKSQKPGQFVIIRVDDKGERIPLTIANSNQEKGTVTIIVQAIGKTTVKLNAMEEGESIADVVGPLGKPSHIEHFGRVVTIGGGVGTAIAWPTTRAFKKAGNEVISIIGARTKELLILEDEMRAVSDRVIVTTDDGSYANKGFVTDSLKGLIDNNLIPNLVLAIGPVPMMRAVAELTKKYAIPTVVSLNPIMLDGTGMCGVCRVSVGGKTMFACVDGPEFDAHEVDFAGLMQRLKVYQKEEKLSLELLKSYERVS